MALRLLLFLLALAVASPALAQVSIVNGVLTAPLPLTYDNGGSTYNVYGYTSTAPPTAGQHGVYNSGATKLDGAAPAAGGNVFCDLEMTLEDPISGENATIGYTDAAITLTKIVVVVQGSAPSVTWNVKDAAARNTAGSAVMSSDVTTTSESGQTILAAAMTGDYNFEAGTFVWLTTSAVSGTIDEIFISACYTLD